MAAALGIIGAVVGAIGQIAQANATAAAAKYNAALDRRNRLVVLNQADNEARDKVRENQRSMASIRAQYGASGFTLEGSPLDVMEDTAIEQEYDVAKVRYRGELKAIGYKDSEQLHKMEAKAAKTAGMIGAIGSIFGAGQSLMAAA